MFGLKYVYKKTLPEGVFLGRNNKWVVRVKRTIKNNAGVMQPIVTSIAQFKTEKQANKCFEKEKEK